MRYVRLSLRSIVDPSPPRTRAVQVGVVTRDCQHCQLRHGASRVRGSSADATRSLEPLAHAALSREMLPLCASHVDAQCIVRGRSTLHLSRSTDRARSPSASRRRRAPRSAAPAPSPLLSRNRRRPSRNRTAPRLSFPRPQRRGSSSCPASRQQCVPPRRDITESAQLKTRDIQSLFAEFDDERGGVRTRDDGSSLTCAVSHQVVRRR